MKMLRTLFKLIRLKLLNAYRNLYKSYIRDKYNVTGDICFVYGLDKPTWSMLRVLGFKKFFKFLRDWKGDSKVGDIVVIKYSVMS
jgi:hypothetical protein